MLRKPQQELKIIAEKIADGVSPVKKIIASVVPGGGKSMMPGILGKALQDAGLIDKLCWVVPRLSLQEQGAREFLNVFSKKLIGHNMTLREATNEVNPCRGLSGYITTYQAIGGDSLRANAWEFSRYRYLLVLDEPHHVIQGGAWQKALQPLVDRCAYLLMMSGTLSRNDRQTIAFLDYLYNDIGELVVDDYPQPDVTFIRYGRRDALEDRNIIPIDFRYMDGKAEWIDRAGEKQAAKSFTDSEENTKEAIWTALHTDYAHQLLAEAVSDWGNYKKKTNPRSKLLVVSPRQELAKTYQKWLDDLGIKSLIAISQDSKAAVQAINRFKDDESPNKVDCLVTVAMAYEGLDVPPITHIACLTHIRSQEWLDQMFGRATRVDKGDNSIPVEYQRAFAFVPDDPFMQEAVDRIRTEQATAAREWLEIDPDHPRPWMKNRFDDEQPRQNIVPMGSKVTRQRVEDDKDIVGYSETESILKAMRDNKIYGVSVISFKNAMIQAGMVADSAPQDEDQDEGEILTPKQKESNLRASIESHNRRYEYQHNLKYGTLNKRLIQVFGKSRDVMDFGELTKVWKYIQAKFPIHDEQGWGMS